MKQTGVFLGGTNPIALDVVAGEIIGLPHESLFHGKQSKKTRARIDSETSYYLILTHNPLIPGLLDVLKFESLWPQCLISSSCTEA